MYKTFIYCLTAVFIGLKLAGVGVIANWSWWIVFSPLWGSAIVLITMWIIAVAVLAWAEKRTNNVYVSKGKK